MVDGVLSAQAQNASAVGRSERSSARGPVQPVRGSSATGQRAFGASFAEASASFLPASNDQTTDQPAVGGGLLSTGVQVLLAETRSQEAAAPFVPPSNVDRAINVYLETQSQVKDTIRSAGGEVTERPLPSSFSRLAQREDAPDVTSDNLSQGLAAYKASPIDSSIDG
jgi:hypothetical protein